jgi:hypothetical protein
MSDTLEAKIRKLGTQYPDSRTAILPALRLAQEQNGGWLTLESFELVGDALELTPAYCQAVASFYDMFHQAPVGRHSIEVCTNLSCALSGAQQVVEAFEQSSASPRARRPTTALSRFARSSVSAAAATPRSSPWTTATASTWGPRTCRQSWRVSVGLRQMLLGGTDEHDLTKLAEYQSIGGYGQVEKARAMTSDDLIAELQKANLRGRGGAGFPMGRKASLLDRKSPKPKYLVVNADESEPGAFKDREVMAKAPHRLLEGCLIAAHAIESQNVFIYIRGEYLTEYEILQRAVDEARAAGIFGDVDVTVYRGAGAYICGEETALLDSLEGRRGQPRPRPPFPPIQGLYAAPTQINNVCTIATVPAILELGPDGFTSIGTPGSPGTVLFSISGNVERPGTTSSSSVPRCES